MALVYYKRGEKRQDLFSEVIAYICFLVFSEFIHRKLFYSVLFKEFHNIPVSFVFLRLNFFHPFKYCIKLFTACHIGLVFAQFRISFELIEQCSHSYHKKFVEIGLKY